MHLLFFMQRLKILTMQQYSHAYSQNSLKRHRYSTYLGCSNQVLDFDAYTKNGSRIIIDCLYLLVFFLLFIMNCLHFLAKLDSVRPVHALCLLNQRVDNDFNKNIFIFGIRFESENILIRKY